MDCKKCCNQKIIFLLTTFTSIVFMKSVSFVTSALFTRISNPPSAFTAFLNVSINKKKIN